MIVIAAAWAIDAEGERIAEELPKAAREGQWTLIERQYQRLVDQHPTVLSGPIHRLGAEAARSRGDLVLTAQRLMRVRPGAEGYDASVGDLDVLDRGTGLVMLQVSGDVALEAEQLPFAPDLRTAVQAAAQHVVEKGHFVGLLPVGSYRLGTQTFTVDAETVEPVVVRASR